MKRLVSGLISVGMLVGGAQAQQPASPPAAAMFTTDEAARCAAVFAFTLDAMAIAPNVPAAIRQGMSEGLASWEYELSLSAPNATREDLQSAANRAVAYVRADMPAGDTPDSASARGEFLTAAAASCQEQLRLAYAGKPHPVVALLRSEGGGPQIASGQAAPRTTPSDGPPAVAPSSTVTAETLPGSANKPPARGLR